MSESIIDKYQRIRSVSEELCKPLKTEDYVVQPIEDVSPPKWHLGHTSWFFEIFILLDYKPRYALFNKIYPYLFNSYYEHKGERILRANRGNLSRPTVEEVYKYRRHIDEEMMELLASGIDKNLYYLIEVGLNHEQQHQELFLTDIKYILGHNPIFPEYHDTESAPVDKINPAGELIIESGLYDIGYKGNDFCYDNELPAHKVHLPGCIIQDRLITNEEYLEFIDSGAYQNHEYWLSDGWVWVNSNKINSPLYWHRIDNEWYVYNLNGLAKVNPLEPVAHISYYEAEAFATWKGMRMPTEFEWEIAAEKYAGLNNESNFLNNKLYRSAVKRDGNNQLLGDVWEWTSGAYLPYPGYKQAKGALGEYNGKFMSGQMVLRGGSCATPADHIRNSYRNFFQPEKRWQFTGIRLTEDL